MDVAAPSRGRKFGRSQMTRAGIRRLVSRLKTLEPDHRSAGGVRRLGTAPCGAAGGRRRAAGTSSSTPPGCAWQWPRAVRATAASMPTPRGRRRKPVTASGAPSRDIPETVNCGRWSLADHSWSWSRYPLSPYAPAIDPTEWLERELNDLDTDLRQPLDAVLYGGRRTDLLRTVPGVGEQVSLTLAGLPA